MESIEKELRSGLKERQTRNSIKIWEMFPNCVIYFLVKENKQDYVLLYEQHLVETFNYSRTEIHQILN